MADRSIPVLSTDSGAPHLDGEHHVGHAWAALIRLSNQSGTLLLMLPTLWALVVASHGRPPLLLLAIFAVGSFVMRSAGVVMNDLADRAIDRQVERTRLRPLASGRLSARHALVLIGLLLTIAAILLLALNQTAVVLSPVAVVLAACYPFAKRIVALPQAVLGMAFGWGVVMAWTAVTEQVELSAWLLYGATIAWAIAYDTIYALQDREDDVRIGVKSSAILFGEHTWLAVAIALLVMIVLLAVVAGMAGANAAFFGVLAGIAGFLGQHVKEIRRPIDRARAFQLFKQHVWVGWAVLAAFWLGFL